MQSIHLKRMTPKLLTTPRITAQLLTIPGVTSKLLTTPRITPKLLTIPRITPKLLTIPRMTPNEDTQVELMTTIIIIIMIMIITNRSRDHRYLLGNCCTYGSDFSFGSSYSYTENSNIRQRLINEQMCCRYRAIAMATPNVRNLKFF